MRNSILVKIITMFLCVILPAYGTIAFSYGRMSQILRTNILESTKLQTVHYMETLEVNLLQVAQLQQEYINDTDLQVFGIANQLFTNRERQQIISRLQARVTRIKDSRQFMMETGVYIFSMAFLIQANRLQVGPTPFGLDDLRSKRQLSEPRVLCWDDEFYLITVYPDNTVNTQPTFLVYTRISKPDIHEFMRSMELYEGAVAVLYNEEGQIVGANLPEADIEHMHLSLDQTWEYNADGERILHLDGYYQVTNTSPAMGLTLSVFFPHRVAMREVDLMSGINLVVLILLSLLSVLFAMMIYRDVYKPLTVLEHAFRQVEDGEANVRISRQKADEFNRIYERFNRMVERLHQLVARVYQQEIESKRSELKQLQSQINPHFLYNSFFIIYRLAKMKDIDTLTVFAHHLGEYFRYVTRNRADEVALRDELKHAMDYVGIQDIRFSNRICVVIDALNAKYESLLVPRLILQPILENCYAHGFSGEVPYGDIHMRFVERDGMLQIQIENTGDSIEQQKCDYLMRCVQDERTDVECTGIINVSRRLKLCFMRDNLLRIEPMGKEGVSVTLFIPLEGARVSREGVEGQ